MKTKLTILRLITSLYGIFTTTAVFGQTTYTWTGAADETNLATAGNWNPVGLPDGSTQDIAQWDGLTTSNLLISYASQSLPVVDLNGPGISLVLTANQTNSVQIISPIAGSPLLPLDGITNSSSSAAFALGDGITDPTNRLQITTRPNGGIHYWVNNSAAPVTINPSVELFAGGATAYTLDFGGTGDWVVNHHLRNDNFVPPPGTIIQKDGPGTMTWTAGDITGNSPIGPLTINGGTLILLFGGLLDTNQPVTNNATLIYDAGFSTQTFNNIISGTGQLKVNAGTVNLNANNTYTGATTVNGGTLRINGSNSAAATFVNGGTLGGTGTLSGPLTLNVGGTLAPGASSGNSVATFTINNDLTINGGNLAIDVDKSNSQPNDFIVVSGVLTNASIGVITVNSFGPLAVGDKFILFNKPLQNGAALTVSGFGAFWSNNLAVDGSISVSSVPPVYTWTNAAGGDLATAVNWSPNGQPSGYPGPGDTAQWDGVTAGPLTITYGTTSLPNTGGFTFGIGLVFSSNQVSSVNFTSTASAFPGSALLGLNNITIASGAGAVAIGNSAGPGPGNTFLFNIVTRPSGALHDFLNNSANAATINGDVRWQAGGGSVHTLDFDGPGNWVVNNYLLNDNGAGILIQKDGSGTMTWTPTGYLGSSVLNSPVTINAGTLVLAGSHPRLGSQAIANNATFQFNAPSQSQTLSGVISGGGTLQVNNGTLTLLGANTYTGGTTINAGTLQVGTNGTSGSLGTGNVTNNSVLVFNRSDSVTFNGAVSGAGSVVQNGSGTLTLTGANIYTGPTTASNGTLVVNSVGGNMNVNGGTLVPGGVGSIGTLTVAGDMNISSGAILASLNKSLSPSNATFAVNGGINGSGGTLKLFNFGPNLGVGDKFIIFNKLVTGGAGMTIVSPGFTVNNNLAVDGSVTVATVATPGSGQIAATLSGGQLNLSWPTAYKGLNLQVQTNLLTIGLSTNWVTIPGTDAGNSYSATLNSSNGCVFFRLAP